MPETTTAEAREPGTIDHALQGFAEVALRATASPLPRDPAAFGWQIIASRLAATAARLMVELNQVAPEQAARVAAWDAGPLGDGLGPMESTGWVIKNVLIPAGVDVDQALAEARAGAESAAVGEAR